MSEEKKSPWGMDSFKKAKNAVGSAIDSVQEAGKKVESAIDTAQYEAESLYHNVSTAVEDKFEGAKHLSQGLVRSSWSGGTLGLMAIGTGVVSIPFSIGIAAIGMIVVFLGDEYDDSMEEHEKSKKSRHFKYAANFVQKYGKLPEVGVLDNDYICIKLNSKELHVEGHFVTGEHEGKSFDDLTIPQLEEAALQAPDDDTWGLMEAYIKYRKKRDGK